MSTMDTRFAVKDGDLTVINTQDCTPIAEMCKKLHNEGKTGHSEMKLAASIPDIMVEAYCIRHNITFNEFCSNHEHIKRIMNDPALSVFRIWKGKI